MNKKGRCLIWSLLFIATFFFLFSCGIPTYILLNDLTISADSINHSISISGKDESLSEVNDGPGLVLLYSTDSEASDKISEISLDFANYYKSKQFGTIPFYSNSGYVGEFGGVEFYCFETSDKEYEKAFEFALNLNNKIPGTYSLKTSGTDIIISYNNEVESSLLWPDNDINSSIYVFAAFTAQGTDNNNFSNIYWSDFVYVGNFSKDE